MNCHHYCVRLGVGRGWCLTMRFVLFTCTEWFEGGESAPSREPLHFLPLQHLPDRLQNRRVGTCGPLRSVTQHTQTTKPQSWHLRTTQVSNTTHSHRPQNCRVGTCGPLRSVTQHTHTDHKTAELALADHSGQ